jgi:nucleotide-binding universal stress UspA family protein
MHAYTTIIWATDGSPGADDALAEAVKLAELGDGHIVALHCDQRLNGRSGGWHALAGETDRRLAIRDQVDELQAQDVRIELLVKRTRQEAADTVAEVATELGADLVVCGARGLGTLAGVLLGSFTQRLLQISPCPVLVVPQSAVRTRTGSEEHTGARA